MHSDNLLELLTVNLKILWGPCPYRVVRISAPALVPAAVSALESPQQGPVDGLWEVRAVFIKKIIISTYSHKEMNSTNNLEDLGSLFFPIGSSNVTVALTDTWIAAQ